MKHSHTLLAIILAGMLAGCTDPATTRKPPPRLTIVLVIGQFRYDYLQRFAGYWQGGIAKLRQEGAVFSNAHHEHAITACAPGHATLLTGAHPARHGIVGDQWFDRERGKMISCIADSASLNSSSSPSIHKSPLQLQATTLGDWLKQQDSSATVVSISGQDHAAILMGGRRADGVYWFDDNTGAFVSSSAYDQEAPAWLREWNVQRYAERYRQTVWEKLLPESAYFAAREDLFAAEGDGMNTTFPHGLEELSPDADTSFYAHLMASPFGDFLTLEFAQAAMRAHALGQDDHPDLLCLSLSATEAIGRAFGPLSQEMQDHLLRLDLQLGNFFAWLEANIGLNNCAIVFASDHGVMPLPEELRRRGFEAARVPREEMQREIDGIMQEAQANADTATDSTAAILLNGIYFSRLAAAGGVRIDLRQRAENFQSLSFVAKVFPAHLSGDQNEVSENFLARFRHAHFAGRSPDLFLHRKPFYLLGGESPLGTQHGSEYDYDTHVPLVFWGAPFRAGQYERKIATVDFAPTLAFALGISVMEKVDGRVLPEAVKRQND